MTEKILREIEQLVDTEALFYELDEKIEQLEATGAGAELITPLLQIMERHPLEDFGMPGAMVHFIENFHPEYEPLLVESLKRQPALHTVWMLNRCINGNPHKNEYIALLKEIADRNDIDKAICDSALDFYNYQNK